MKSAHLFSAAASLSLLIAACGGAPEVPPASPPTDAPVEPPAAPAADAKPAGSGEQAATPAPTTAPAPAAAPAPVSIEVPIEARSNSKIKGKATFIEVEGGVKVTIQISGAPAGKVATHVHEKGDCSAPDGKSAGDHFNPEKHPHGLPDGAQRHLGDLGNIEVKADGTGTHEITVKGANLKPNDPNSFVGRAIIVHEKKDDGGQPTGNAGGRVGCGVIATK